MVMLIFGVLGVTMATLFSTSISSSATDNDQRRALYLSESGTRYAMSELRHRGFSDSVIDPLNQTLFNLPPPGAFDLNILSYWFEFASGPDIPGSGTGTITVDIPKGEIPQGAWPSTPGNLLLVQCNYDVISLSDPNPRDSARALVTGFTIDPLNRTTLDINLADDGTDGFAQPYRKAQLCFAVKPYSDQLIVPFSELRVDAAAKDIFPKTDGAIEVNRRPLFYKNAVDRGSYVELTDITFASWDPLYAAPLEQVRQASDYVILSPRNYLVLSQGLSSNVTFGGDMAHSMAVARQTAGGDAPAIGPDNLDYSETGDFQQTESTPNFIQLNETEKSITIGGGSDNRLGSVLFRDTRNIGGTRNFCSNGSCLFGQGIRLFFTLEYTGSGDGFVFALISGNPSKNDAASAGGDIERSEMLGYSGDSRLTNTPTGSSDFLDNSGPTTTPGGTTVRGLIAPKIGLEFDGKVNHSTDFERTVNYCSSASNLKADTRNDTGSTNRDAVQYVFWGNSALNINCRTQPYCGSSPGCTGDPGYDDNRHEATWPGNQNWQFNTFWSINSSPALAADGTIFVGSGSTNFYALNPDGTQKWLLDRNGAWYSPTVAPSGRIYVGSGPPENRLFAINPDTGAVIWTFPTGGAVTTKPAVRSDGSAIYFGSDDGYVYAVNSSGAQLWRFDTGSAVKSSPALSNSGNFVYFGAGSGTFYALRADNGVFVWSNSPFPRNAFQSSPVVGPDGSVYVGNDNGWLYSFNGSTGATRWSAYPSAGSAIQSSPAVSNDGSVVYVGSFDDNLYAFNTSNGSEKWRYTAGNDIQGPIAVDANDHIYFGSNDNRVYALYYDGTEKWRFLTNGDVRVKPAVKSDGSVYVGSYDFQVYAINQFANPKSLKDLLITSTGSGPTTVGGVPVTVDSNDNWFNGSTTKRLWAVRMEVTRSLTQTGGTYDYNLRTWVRQCDQPNCDDVIGTFYADTRIDYFPTSPIARPPMMEQTIKLLPADHQDFERFLFGFTSQTASGETQSATIREFQLSFIRLGDPDVTNDPNWP